jgi:hypothetical protein
MGCKASVGGEPIAHAGLGEEESRPGRVGLQLAAQVTHVDVDVLDLSGVLGPPHLSEEAIGGEHLAGVAQEHEQELVLDGVRRISRPPIVTCPRATSTRSDPAARTPSAPVVPRITW